MNFVFCPRRRRKGKRELKNSPKLNCAKRTSIIIKKKNLDTHTHAHALVVSSSKPTAKRARERV